MPVQLEIQKLPQTQLVLVKEPHVFYTSLLVHGAPEPDAAGKCRTELSFADEKSLSKQTPQTGIWKLGVKSSERKLLTFIPSGLM